MRAKLSLVLLGWAIAASAGAQTAAQKPHSIYLDWREGAKYFPFPEGSQLKVTELACPSSGTVSVICRTASRASCGSWYLGLNGTATAGAGGTKGVASLNYNGPRNANCAATVVVQKP